jgi:hypothetical protein
MKKLISLLLIALLTACASVVKVEGEQVINGHMAVQPTQAWNKFALPNNRQPFEIWTQDGITLDQLRFWAAIAPGQSLMAAPTSPPPAGQKAPRIPTYTAGMPPDQLVSLFEILYAHDGSLVTVTRVEPTVFAGEKGARFEFSVVRKSDSVQLSGVGWVALKKNELYAATFVAPKLSFFPRLLPQAERVVKTASIR